MIQSGYILIFKKLVQWEWWDNPLMVKGWIYLLLSANYEDKMWMGKIIKRGSFVTSQYKLCCALNCSRFFVNEMLFRLKNSGQITLSTNNKYTLITICNYDSYQQCFTDTEDNKKDSNESNKKDSNESNKKDSCESNKKDSCENTTNKINNINNINNNWEIPKLVSVENILEILENSENRWKEIAAMKIGCKISDLSEMFRMFQSELIAQGLKEKKENEIKRHFINMMRAIKNKNHGNNKTSNGANRYGTLGRTINSAAENGDRVENIIQLASELAKCDQSSNI